MTLKICPPDLIIRLCFGCLQDDQQKLCLWSAGLSEKCLGAFARIAGEHKRESEGNETLPKNKAVQKSKFLHFTFWQSWHLETSIGVDFAAGIRNQGKGLSNLSVR